MTFVVGDVISRYPWTCF